MALMNNCWIGQVRGLVLERMEWADDINHVQLRERGSMQWTEGGRESEIAERVTEIRKGEGQIKA